MPTNIDRVVSFVKKTGCCFSVHKQERARTIVETDVVKERRKIVAEYCKYVEIVSNS